MTSSVYQFDALTDLWTGDINGDRNRLIVTGLLGSIRWWFEVVARGLGGAPCDPSSTKCIDRKHCVVCELFGCTGWARKFRFDVLGESDAGQECQIKRGRKFKLRFTPLRSICDEEWVLLDLTLRLIADHGAIGGKTVFKPTDEDSRQGQLHHQDSRQGQLHHQDFGLIKLVSALAPTELLSEQALRAYASDSRWRTANSSGSAWASLANFWSVPGQYLARQDPDHSTFNQVIGRGERKSSAGNGDSWLAGRRARSKQGDKPEVKAESKKVFSFRDPPRTFGFVNPNGDKDIVTLATIKQRLEKAWGTGSVGDGKLVTGGEILKQLLQGGATP